MLDIVEFELHIYATDKELVKSEYFIGYRNVLFKDTSFFFSY